MKRRPAGGSEYRVPAGRRRLLLGVFLLLTLAAIGRAFQIQVVEGGSWRGLALQQHRYTLVIPAPRGTMYDRNGIPLAATQEVYRVALAPQEIADTALVVELLRRECGLSERQARDTVALPRRWILLPRFYPATVREALDNVRGIHFESAQRRFYPHQQLAKEVLGAVSVDGRGQSGLELELDSVLRGQTGQATVRRDPQGNPLPGMMLRTREPVPGSDVFLTLDVGLQEIADDALRQAIDSAEARGGELLLVDPSTGEILAAASQRGGTRSFSWRAATEPYEPGSTLKPFTIAGLLTLHRVTLDDSVFAENGVYPYPGRKKPITDVHPYGMLSVADALRKSSNVALSKLAGGLSANEHYRFLRDFGFGSATGIPYPSESAGLLAHPTKWTPQTQPSLAMGYEIAVTPLQMVMAYSAIANGGLLLAPRLVREVRGRDGRARSVLEAIALRRALPEAVAAELRSVLEGAVTEGTAQQAQLGPFSVAGKTGTAKVAAGGGYQSGAYIASFAGFFPADQPQLAFLVKIDEPRGGQYYGGIIAAPVIRRALEAALAARHTPLDRRAVATPAPELPDAGEIRAAAVLAPSAAETTLVPAANRRVDLHAAQPAGAPSVPPSVVPATAGLSLRDAVEMLHAAGLRARVNGRGRVRRSQPASGDTVRAGAVVQLVAEGA